MKYEKGNDALEPMISNGIRKEPVSGCSCGIGSALEARFVRRNNLRA